MLIWRFSAITPSSLLRGNKDLEECTACNFTFALQLETASSLKRLPHYTAS